MEMSEESGVTTECNNDGIYDSTEYNNDYIYALQSLQKLRDDITHKQRVLQERMAQCDMHIQTILSEGTMTSKVVLDKYEEIGSNMMEVANSSCSRDGSQSITRIKGLRAAVLGHACQDLDEICRVGNWIFPRYTVVPSVSDEMYHASVFLRCPDFEMSIDGGPSPSPREARCSAAVNMILELHRKAKEQEQLDT